MTAQNSEQQGSRSKEIVVVGHKPFTVPKDSMYLGMQVGYGEDIPSLKRDNTGDNIAYKNDSYCELTAQYWLWKNSDASIKGLVHYRRILGTPGSRAIPFESIDKRRGKALSSDDVDQLLSQYDIILPKAHDYITETALQHYERAHVSGEGFEIIRQYLKENYPEYVDAFEYVLNAKKTHLLNILITNSKLFDRYSEWLFDVLKEVEDKIDISKYSPTEKRVFGYLSELLLDVWIRANHFSYIEVPVLFLQRQNLPKRYFFSALKKMGFINPARDERKGMMVTSDKHE